QLAIAAPVAVAVVIAVATGTRNTENAVDGADRTTDTSADCATDRRTHRARYAAAVIRSPSSALLHSTHNALCMRQMRDREQTERNRRRSQPAPGRRLQ